MRPGFHVGTRIFTDYPATDVLPVELERMQVSRILVVTDPGVRRAGLLEPLLSAVPKSCTVVDIFDDVIQDPTVGVMDKAGALCRREKVDAVVAVGGGAALDTGKAAAIVAKTGGSIRDSVGEFRLKEPGLPVIAIPTTAGTGSEVTWHISVNDVERKLKVTVRSPLAVPAVAILDPNLITTVPPLVAAAAGMDALTHAVESFVGNNGAWELTDALALKACSMIGQSLIPYCQNPTDLHHGLQMLKAACFGGLVLSHSRTGIVHQMARPLGAFFNVPHGLANAVLLPFCLEYTVPRLGAKYAPVAEALGENSPGLSPEERAMRLVSIVEEMNAAVGVPTSLSELGVTPDAVEQMAEDALQGNAQITNPCIATKEDVIAIYNNAIRGKA